ncbi:ascorbate transporter, chloroplastic-like [Brassica napus]|uniref:ascorbate transporter, chloroplastic-like n=1 Tax=Brassica napus TaxID=3708 RepID=UPI002079111F|nr:ascorbate transporter, chloroplastic-like [Brassica napus]
MAIFVHIGGWIGDTPMSRGLSITAVRKERSKKYTIIMQSMGSLGPTLFFLSQLNRVKTPAVAVLCMTCRQNQSKVVSSSDIKTHAVPSRALKHSPSRGVLLGLLNTAGVLAGVFGTAATGYILQRGS